VDFPKIPDVQPPRYVYQARRLNFGPDFRKARIITIEPPETGEFFPSLVPQVDPDGNETSGIRMPEIEAPLATYAGWNLRHPSTGAAGTLAQNIGSMFMFSRTKQARESAGDPRQSIEERYPSRQDYLNRIGAAARKLVAGGYLLSEDVEKLIEQARVRWEWFTRPVSSQ
jgi:alpha/beta hydrolase family protein